MRNRKRAEKPKPPHHRAIAAAKHSHTDAGPDCIVCLLCGETYRAINATHLRAAHHFEGEHPVLEYKRLFGLEVAVPEEQRILLRKSAVRTHRRVGNTVWTKASVARAIRERAKKGLPLCLSATPCSLREAARRKFGFWDSALRAAGERPSRHRLLGAWSPERVIRTIQDMAHSGRVSGTRAQAECPTMYNIAIRVHRSWGNALRAAGLDPAEHVQTKGRLRNGYKRLDWSREAVVEAIHERVRVGQSLNVGAAQADGKGLSQQARIRFGSWDAALEAAGIDPTTVRRARTWTRDDVVKEIRARHRAGRPLTFKASMAEEPRLVKAAQRLFPASWAKALSAAGLDPTRARSCAARKPRARRPGHK